MYRYVMAGMMAALPVAGVAAQSDLDMPRWAANMARHQQVIMHGVPAPYSRYRDPTQDTPAKLRRGAALFDQHCASCHGWSGQGSGHEALFLVPAPADLQWLARAPKNRSDPYIYWSIAEGGKRLNSDMPAFKRTLSRQEIWSVIAYVHAGMPRASP
jgi:mono/diheme cytochrome c family protein